MIGRDDLHDYFEYLLFNAFYRVCASWHWLVKGVTYLGLIG